MAFTEYVRETRITKACRLLAGPMRLGNAGHDLVLTTTQVRHVPARTSEAWSCCCLEAMASVLPNCQFARGGTARLLGD